ncbi:hypothetical protein [Paenibacillus oenotherae]|uniref:hypothetical protein n=1 Tax=Paenibacillus oenotherae TaxID=1435645 RepID=UPI003CCE9674
MEWLERMNRAIDYIEENLTGEIELGEAARMACCSRLDVFEELKKAIWISRGQTRGRR